MTKFSPLFLVLALIGLSSETTMGEAPTVSPNPDCCVMRVGDANGIAGDDPSIADIAVMIDVKFTTNDESLIPCMAEADINQSGGLFPTVDDLTIADIALLIDYLFITGESLGLADCRAAYPSFVVGPQTFTPMGTYELELADLDDDYDLDVVFSNMATNCRVLYNDGSGYFPGPGQVLAYGLHGVEIGDIDRDEDPDIVFCPLTASAPSTPIYLNNGSGSFTMSAPGLSYSDMEGLGPTLVDFDRDGDLDIMIERSREYVSLINNGSGQFTPGGVTYPDMSNFHDLNSDGYCDNLVRVEDQGFRVYLNDGSGTMVESSFIPLDHAIRSRTFFADVDNDGDPDAIYTNGEGINYPSGILLNDGAGSFTESGQELATVGMGKVGIGDLNNDGWTDLIFTDWFGGPCQVWLNQGEGVYFDSGIRLGGSGGWGNCAIGDVDGDGDNDVFIAGYSGVTNTLWFNQLIP